MGIDRATVVRAVPVAVLVVGTIAYFGFGLDDIISCETLGDHRADLLAYVDANLFRALALYIVVYAVVIALSVPGGALMTVTGGFLFGVVGASMSVVVGATLGATALFYVARTAFGNLLRARAGPWFGRLEAGFKRDAFSYLLMLRLIPVFPFFIVNIVPAFLGVSVTTYVLATALGIVPATVVFSTIGAGLGGIFETGAPCSSMTMLSSEILLGFSGLALLALVPVLYRKFKNRGTRVG